MPQEVRSAEVVYVNGETLTSEQLVRVARHRVAVTLGPGPEVRQRIVSSSELNRRLVRAGRPVYGVTTGFGESVNRQIGADRADRMSAPQIRRNGCGRGPYLPEDEGRAVVLARVNCLARGYSGVRPVLVENLLALLNRGVTPCIREIGSVGASGDLIPGSYVAATLMGEREAYYQGAIRPAAEALKAIGQDPMVLESKEGLAMTNGTQFMTGLGVLVTSDAAEVARVADVCTVMAVEVLLGITGPFHPFLAAQKPHPGLVASAEHLQRLLKGSQLARDYQQVVNELGVLEEGYRLLTVRIQDKYSLAARPISWAPSTTPSAG